MLDNVKIGDKVVLVAPSGKTRTVTVTDVIRDVFTKLPMALEFLGINGPCQLPMKYFAS